MSEVGAIRCRPKASSWVGTWNRSGRAEDADAVGDGVAGGGREGLQRLV